MVGAIYVALSAWLMLGDDFYGHKIMPGVEWRSFAVVSAIPAIVALVLTYHVIPESPRFLVNKRLFVQAAEVLNALSTLQIDASDLEIDAENSTKSFTADTSVVSSPAFTLPGAVKNGYTPVGSVAAPPPRASTDSQDSIASRGSLTRSIAAAVETSTLALLFKGSLLRTSATLIVIWFTLSFGSYGMSTWISTLFSDVGIGNPYAAAFIFALANLPGNIISLMYIETFGRRWLLSMGMSLAAVSALGFALDTRLPAVVVTCAALFNAFSVVGWNSLDCLSGKHAAAATSSI
jgi:MFS family permease